MARNGVAANLLMFLIIVGGFISFSSVVQEVFPEFSLDSIQIRVEYLGASPDEVEESIVLRVEEQIESIEGIRRITSVASENVGVVTAELQLGTDISDALDKIKAEVDRITTFPVDAEEPEVTELTNRSQVVQLAIHGNASERSLKELANRIKDELTTLPELSYVRVNGVRNYEISIEVDEETLRKYNLQLSDITMAVRRGSLDLPGGSVETNSEEILIRTKGQNYNAADFEAIIVVARPDGTTLRVGDIATVNDGFEDADLLTRFDGNPAAFVEVYRTGDERVLDMVEVVLDYVAQIAPTIPEGISVDVWQNDARLLESRFNLLIENGALGLALVILALALFLDLRLAFWVSIGIFISFIGVFAVMFYMGVSVNLITLFAFILSLGIVVDDAIVIGENVFAEQAKGGDPLEAAIRGAQRLAVPVTFAVLTTVTAFSPLLFAPGTIGKIMSQMPVIVIAVLMFSLIESLFILPQHLSHTKPERERVKPTLRKRLVGGLVLYLLFFAVMYATQGEVTVFTLIIIIPALLIAVYIEELQTWVKRALEWNINGPLQRSLEFATKHYGIVITSCVALVLISGGLIAGGYIKFSFFPDIEGENVIARIELPEGTPTEQTRDIAAFIEARGREVAAEFQVTLPEEHPPLINHIYTSVGMQPSMNQGPNATSGASPIQSHLAEINIELLDAEERELSAEVFESAWRERVGQIPNVKSMAFQSAVISLGKPIQLEISAATPEVLAVAVERLKGELNAFAGVFEIEDDQDPGKREVKLALKPQGRTLGVTLDDLARQVRAGFYGDEALRIQRGRDDIRVMVRLPEDERNAIADIQNLRIRTPAGAEIPLAEVATASFGYGPSAINRTDRRRVATITADVDPDIVTAQEVVSALEAENIPALMQDYPGVRAGFEGEQREQADTNAALLQGFMIALFVIYALLAIPFGSYIQPLIIMAAIPFGLIGAILGHLVFGVSFGLLSVFGIIGLSGVVVNNALVLIDFVNQRYREGLPMQQAIIEAGKVRFRPILLTSLTTFLGILPLILERSVQAQFLVPMAISLGFGILFATFIILLLVPALTMWQYDITSFFKGHNMRTPKAAAPKPAVQQEDRQVPQFAMKKA